MSSQGLNTFNTSQVELSGLYQLWSIDRDLLIYMDTRAQRTYTSRGQETLKIPSWIQGCWKGGERALKTNLAYFKILPTAVTHLYEYLHHWFGPVTPTCHFDTTSLESTSLLQCETFLLLTVHSDALKQILVFSSSSLILASNLSSVSPPLYCINI